MTDFTPDETPHVLQFEHDGVGYDADLILLREGPFDMLQDYVYRGYVEGYLRALRLTWHGEIWVDDLPIGRELYRLTVRRRRT